MTLAALLDRLGHLLCPFSARHILRSCLGACKITYLLRALPSFAVESLASDVQLLLSVCLSIIGGARFPSQSGNLYQYPSASEALTTSTQCSSMAVRRFGLPGRQGFVQLQRLPNSAGPCRLHAHSSVVAHDMSLNCRSTAQPHLGCSSTVLASHRAGKV